MDKLRRGLSASLGLIFLLIFRPVCAHTGQTVILPTVVPPAAVAPASIPRFELRKSGPELERTTRAGAFFDVAGRRSAVYGYERRALEAWAYPLQILDGFELSFRLEGYPQELRGADTATLINVRPEATTITYTHAAFTVRQIIFAPLDDPGIVMLLDVQSALPLTVNVSFRPRLKLMWPAGLMTGNLNWEEKEKAYFISEETGRYVGIVGSPAARDASEMPYQEEPRDVPARFGIEVSTETWKSSFVPIIIAGSVAGSEDAKATYAKLLRTARALYEKNVEHYRRFLDETASIETPDGRLDEAFAWAKIGIDKGVVENPFLGRGLVAGFRTAGESERPGFAWFFGRDALWTTLAINSYGDFATTRAALDFLKKFQRADGKIPHEISQSASLLPWFTDYSYPWASADATPLYIVAFADYWRASGDLAYVRANWDYIVKAYRFTAATDTDANGLVENTKFGHGWVEGGALHPPHEEIYMQGIWIEALRGLSEMASALGDSRLASEAQTLGTRVRTAVEKTYWLPGRGFYAFATSLPRAERRTADPGPNRAVRQSRMNELDESRLVDEDTVLPAVALWWGALEASRAESEIDHLGSAHMATDWGARIISDESRLYDPLSYHHGSVWPLFTGWASVGAYRYGRPHVGFQALMANALLNRAGALGSVTELLSGDFNAPFGRSSHRQIWSEAMVLTPALRGLFGLEISKGGTALRFAPQLPADWNSASVRNFAAGAFVYDLHLTRTGSGRMIIAVKRRGAANSNDSNRRESSSTRVTVAPAFPLDARIREVTLGGRPLKFELVREGDVARAQVVFDLTQAAELVFVYDEGTDVYNAYDTPLPGARNQGLRILRSRAGADGLRLVLEGLGGRTYAIRIRTPNALGETQGLKVVKDAHSDALLHVSFDGPRDIYVRRELVVPIKRSAEATRAARVE